MGALSATVPHGDERRFGPLGHFNNFGYLERMHLAHAATVNAEVLGKTVHATTFNGSMASDHAVAERLMEEHVVVVGSVGDEGVDFQERTFVQQQTKAVACGPSAAGSNRFLALETTAHASRFSLLAKFLKGVVGLALHGSCTSFRFFIQTLIRAVFRDVRRTGSW